MDFQRTLKFTVVHNKSQIRGSLFQAAGLATEKALSPKPVLVLGTSKEPDVEDLRVAQPCNDDIRTRTSVMYSGLLLLTDA